MRNKTGYFIAIILLLSSFFSCNKTVKGPNIMRTWNLHKDKGYYSLAINLKNKDSCNYYLNNVNMLESIKVIDENGKDITFDYIIFETSYYMQDTILAEMIFSRDDTTKYSLKNFEEYKWIYLKPYNKTKLFLQKVFESELEWFSRQEKYSEYKDYIAASLYGNIYRSCLLLDKNSSIEDSVLINTLINLKEKRTIIFKYRPVLKKWKGNEYFQISDEEGFYYHGQPLKEIGGYTLYDKEFTDTIILRDGKIEVKYGN